MTALDFVPIELARSNKPRPSSPWCMHVLHYDTHVHSEVLIKLPLALLPFYWQQLLKLAAGMIM